MWYAAADTSPCARTQHLRNAISKVQRQKQRPTAARICKAVCQCVDNVSANEVTEWLNASVRSGDILLINNDGIISYREPRRNLPNLAPARKTNRPLPVADLFQQPDHAWSFSPQYKPFQDFVMQPVVNHALMWPFSHPVPYDPYVQFADRAVDQYSGWLGSFSPVDTQLMFASDPANYRLHQDVPSHSSYGTSAACLADENWTQPDCSYGFLQPVASHASESTMPSVTSVVASSCQLMDVERADNFSVNSCTDAQRADDNSKMTADVARSTDVPRVSVTESPDIVVEEQTADRSELMGGVVIEQQLNKVSNS